jgi:DNA polymerase-3 subunit gamma/tau
MSYQVLARKWRPKNFQQLMGQEHVVTVLVNALEQQRLHHAYLFTGTRGVGKTTIARIFAKSLNCQKGITSTPCGECDTCLDIDEGRFVDLLEIDAASRTKVDDTREILDNVQYAPTRGRYKVYLIDEVHMLSRSSFNALLKTLEEPPEHVKFILATTDPQKLPITVLSRCLQFHLKALTVGQIEQQLEIILAAENVGHEAGSLTLLAKAARGSMRDSLSLTDQSIAQGQGNITVSNVQEMLGGVDQNWIFKILIALVKQDSAGLMTLSLQIASYAPNYSRLLAELIQLLHQIALAQVIDSHFDLPPEHSRILKKLCRAMSPEDVQLYYQIVLTGRKDLPYAADEQAAFDMVLLRLLAFKPVKNKEALVSDNSAENSAEKADAVDLEFNDELPVVSTKKERKEITKNPTGQHIESNIANQDNSVAQVQEANAEQQVEQQQVQPTEESLSAEMASIESAAYQQGKSIAEPVMKGAEEASVEDIPADVVKNLVEPVIEAVEEIAQVTTEATSESYPEHYFPDHEEVEYFHIEDTYAEHSNVPSPSTQHLAPTPMLDEPSVVTNETVNKEAVQVQPNTQQEESSTGNIPSPIEAALATRNMLRSRKKKMETEVKKSDDASERHIKNIDPAHKAEVMKNFSKAEDKAVNQQEKPVIPAIETIPEQAFTPEVINPEIIRKANQVDKWANMIDSMELGGRVRQLAIHATICDNSTDETLILNLNQSTKHLNSDAAHKQLELYISRFLNKPITVEVNVVEQTVADPYQIQSTINDKRYEYAKELLHNDDVVQTFKTQFQAELDEKTIVAL